MERKKTEAVKLCYSKCRTPRSKCENERILLCTYVQQAHKFTNKKIRSILIDYIEYTLARIKITLSGIGNAAAAAAAMVAPSATACLPSYFAVNHMYIATQCDTFQAIKCFRKTGLLTFICIFRMFGHVRVALVLTDHLFSENDVRL